MKLSILGQTVSVLTYSYLMQIKLLVCGGYGYVFYTDIEVFFSNSRCWDSGCPVKGRLRDDVIDAWQCSKFGYKDSGIKICE